MSTITIPITCYRLKQLLLFGATILLVVSIYQLFHGIEIAFLGFVVGFTGSITGWVLQFVSWCDNGVIKCKCDEDD